MTEIFEVLGENDIPREDVRVIEYPTPRAFGFIGDGKVRIIPKDTDAPIFSIALSDRQIRLLIEDGTKYLLNKAEK